MRWTVASGSVRVFVYVRQTDRQTERQQPDVNTPGESLPR